MVGVAQDAQVWLAERETLLQRIVSQQTDDKRVVATWLYGSRGPNTGDTVSDIDVRVVVADHFSEVMKAKRQAHPGNYDPLEDQRWG